MNRMLNSLNSRLFRFSNPRQCSAGGDSKLFRLFRHKLTQRRLATPLAVLLGVFVSAAIPARADTLSFYGTLADALGHSYDVKLARANFKLAHNEMRNALTDYFPTLRGQANMEYMRDLTRQVVPTTVIGGTAIPNGTRFQFVVENVPEYRLYQAQIEAKKRELQALKRQRLPVFSLYSNFYMYGFDRDSWVQALGDFKGRTISLGIGAAMPIFDGFKNRVACDRVRLEIARLEIERDKKLWELQDRRVKLSTSVKLLNKQFELKDGVLSQGTQKVVRVRRLTDSQIAERTVYLTQQARLIEDELERDRTRLERVAAVRKLQVLSEG
jgi:outer membrane protein TolC